MKKYNFQKLDELIAGWNKKPEKLNNSQEIQIPKTQLDSLLKDIKAQCPRYIIVGEEHCSDEAFYLVKYLLHYKIAKSLYLEPFDVGDVLTKQKKTIRRLNFTIYPEKWYKLTKLAEAKGMKVHGLDKRPHIESKDVDSYRMERAAKYLAGGADKPAIVLLGAAHVGGSDGYSLEDNSNIISRLIQSGVKRSEIMVIGAYFLPSNESIGFLHSPNGKKVIEEGHILKSCEVLGKYEEFKDLSENYKFADYVLFFGGSWYRNLFKKI